MKKIRKLISVLFCVFLLSGCIGAGNPGIIETNIPDNSASVQEEVSENGVYTDKEHVAQYIHLYGHLPKNYITKKEAEALGWNSFEGNLDEVAPGKSIGGDHFGNYEGSLPEKPGRTYRECDIDYKGGRRNGKRIVYSDDGWIYYTSDHYASFIQLYGDEK